MAIFKFLDGLETSPLHEFWDFHDHDVPSVPGVYVLASKGGTHFPYPGGNSPIFYIGQSTSLLLRLRNHLMYARQAKENRRIPLYWPRYEYAAKFGARYCYIRTWQGLKPKALEDIVLARFAKRYLSFPIANGSGAWSRIAKEISLV